jgi:hypothetical protein
MRIIEERHFSWQGLPGLPYGLPVPPTARGQFSTPSISALKNQGQKMSTIERATSLDRVCLRVCRRHRASRQLHGGKLRHHGRRPPL